MTSFVNGATVRVWCCRSVKHSVAKFFGVAHEDEAKRQRTLNKWQASSRRLQSHSFMLSRRSSQRRTVPRSAPLARSATTAAEYEMTRRAAASAPGSATSQQLLSSGQFDSTDGGISTVSSQTMGSIPPHPLDPHAQPPMYVQYDETDYEDSLMCHCFLLLRMQFIVARLMFFT